MNDDDLTPDAPDELWDELRGHFARTDPVPEIVLAAARAAIEFLDLDVRIAELLADSATESEELVGVRGDSSRMLSFGAGDEFVELSVVEQEGGNAEASGYVLPAGEGTVRVETPGGASEAPIDAAGRFRLPRIPRGPARLVVLFTGRPPLVTRWVAL